MRLVLTLILLATSAAAQTPDSTAARRRGPSPTVVIGGALAGVATMLVGSVVIKAVGGPDESAWGYALYPLGAAVGVHGLSRDRGLTGSFRQGAAQASIAAVVGYAIGYGLGAGQETRSVSGQVGVGLAGGAVVLLLPPLAAAGAYYVPDVQPVVLVAPDGLRAAGLSLTVPF